MQTAMVWPYFQFTESDQNHLAWYAERGKKTRQTKEEVGKQHQEMDRLANLASPEGSAEQRQLERKWWQSHLSCPNEIDENDV